MRRKLTGPRTVVALSALALVLSPILALDAGASGGGYGSFVPVAQGITPSSLPGAEPFENTPPSTPEQVSFILDEQNKSQLETSVESGVSSYLSVSQFAAQYGQSSSNISELTGYLNSFGITTNVYPDNVDVSTTGTAGEYNKALSVQQDDYRVPAFPSRSGTQGVPAQTVHGSTTAPELPSELAQFVLAILGLSNYSPFTSQAIHATSSLQPTTTSGNSGTAACLALTGLPDGCNTPADYERDYNLSPLESADAGAGQTIGVVTLAALDVGAPEYFWSNVLDISHPGTVTVDNIDGGPGAPSYNAGTGETDLDVEQSGGIAPGANIVVYQAPNTDPGFADAFFTAASQNVAGSIGCSWGEPETAVAQAVASGEETPAYEAAFDEAFLELAAQGQATFVAAGDSGAYDASGDVPATTNLSVDTPADSPFVTVGGGTTLPWSATFENSSGVTASVNVAQQRAWAWDYLWQPIATLDGVSEATVAESLVAGGGGGFSVVEPTPSYQQGVSGVPSFQDVEYLTPTDYENVDGLILPTAWNFDAAPSVQRGFGTGRAVPDVSANADPETGYLEYSPSFAQETPAQPVLEGAWGGTSFIAQQFSGTTAVLDSVVGHRVGFWNPSIYAFAQSFNSPFTPLQQPGTSNDNDYYTGNPGTIYNEATGLGIPNFARLARDFGH